MLPRIFMLSGVPLRVEWKSTYNFPYTSDCLVCLAFSNSKLLASIFRFIFIWLKSAMSTSPSMVNGVFPLVKILKRLNVSLLSLISTGLLSNRRFRDACGTYTFTLSRLIFPFMSGWEALPDICMVPSISPLSIAILPGIKEFAISSGKWCNAIRASIRSSFCSFSSAGKYEPSILITSLSFCMMRPLICCSPVCLGR